MFSIIKKKEIYPAYVSKNNSNCKKKYSYNDKMI